MYLRPKKKRNSKTLGRRMAVGIERKRFMQVTQMWPFSSPSPTDDKLQVWRNRLFGYKKPSIMISVIISSWPRPYSNQVINTHIILLKEIWKCIPDCQRKGIPCDLYYNVPRTFFLPFIHLQEILKTNISWIQRCFWPASGMILKIQICYPFPPWAQLSECVTNISSHRAGGRQRAHS